MNTFTGKIKRVILSIIIILLIVCLIISWRQNQKYTESIMITADFMQYACGDCTLDMKVTKTDNSKFSFILNHDIFPIPRSKSANSLCNYITTAYYAARENENLGIQPFTIIGRLYKHRRSFLFSNCSETPFFEVEKIKLGEGEWVVF